MKKCEFEKSSKCFVTEEKVFTNFETNTNLFETSIG